MKGGSDGMFFLVDVIGYGLFEGEGQVHKLFEVDIFFLCFEVE